MEQDTFQQTPSAQQRATDPATITVRLEITLADVNIILQGLNLAPLGTSRPVFDKVLAQAQDYIRATQTQQQPQQQPQLNQIQMTPPPSPLGQ